MQTQKVLILLVKVAVKFRVLQISKILNTDTNRVFPIPFKVMYVSLRYTQFEKQFRSKQIQLLVWGEPKIFPSKCFFFLIKCTTRSFMLNTMMENENKRFANISIPFLLIFVMKLIAQINILFFPKLKVLAWSDLKYINKRNHPLLSKSKLKYLVYCQVFWIKVWGLQNQ